MTKIPIGISNRHIHLSQEDTDILFGKNHKFQILKELTQPGQYAYKESVTIKGEKGEIGNVRILGPVRKDTQVEILLGDQFILGTKAPIRISGDLKNTPGIEIIGPKGKIKTKKGVIIAQRHLHISLEEAKKLKLKNKQSISVKIGTTRKIIMENVIVRIGKNYRLDCHIDREEGNAAGLETCSYGEII